ncbi:MAG: DUF3501 family protein [Proteobacteria bacterium]|nr:DUF3501 family protein [Pseudomonadota bacterium]MCZ6784252.1 DUF3501 family protein [Pseudomonadota bacterium]
MYNELVPGENELSATLFIEIPELARIRPELVQRFAAELAERHGGCRVETDVRTGPAAKLRFRLIAVPAAQGASRPTGPPDYRPPSSAPTAMRTSERTTMLRWAPPTSVTSSS